MRKSFWITLVAFLALAIPATGYSSNHSSSPKYGHITISQRNVSSYSHTYASRPYYGGGQHTTSHGGHYPGETNAHHKGGHYSNPKINNRYGIHKLH
jgi:uncharacterized membrane protein